jgi:hypothetical protein
MTRTIEGHRGRHAAFELDAAAEYAGRLHGDRDVLHVDARHRDRCHAHQIVGATSSRLHLQQIPSWGDTGELETAIRVHHAAGHRREGRAVLRSNHHERVVANLLEARHATADPGHSGRHQAEGDARYLLAGAHDDLLRLTLRRRARVVGGRVALFAVRHGSWRAAHHHHSHHVAERRRDHVFTWFETVHAEAALVVGGIGTARGHQPTSARHIAEPLHLHHCLSERIAELV